MEHEIYFDFTFKKIEFLNHDGRQITMKNPKVSIHLRKTTNINYEYKIAGQENDRNEGFFYGNINFYKGAIEYTEVVIPKVYLEVLKREYEEICEINRNILVSQDFRYLLHDTSSYGIYNGISEFDLEEIMHDIKKDLGCNPSLYPRDVYKILTEDSQIKQIALDTYIPYPSHDGFG